MPRNVFDEELARLNADLAEMGRRIDSIMQGTIRTLKNMDVAMAKSIFQKDIEITATLKVITDMERISDQCADICEILATVAGISVMNTSPRMIQMFEKAREMVAGAVDAYIRRDSGAAAAICEADDEVDALFSSTVLELCSQISRDSAAVPEHVDFMFIAKYIERMADHATNIAEWAIFIDTGVHPNLNDTQAGK